METDEDLDINQPFRAEPLRAIANEVYTRHDATRLARVPYSADNGISEYEARSYAALFAASPQLREACERAIPLVKAYIANGAYVDSGDVAVLTSLTTTLALCEPSAKGKPFPKPPRKEGPWQ